MKRLSLTLCAALLLAVAPAAASGDEAARDAAPEHAQEQPQDKASDKGQAAAHDTSQDKAQVTAQEKGHDAAKDKGHDKGSEKGHDKGHGKGHDKAAPAKPAPPPPPSPAAAAAPDAEQPWRLIRALHRLQGRLGEGDATAQAAQGDLVADLSRRFDAAPPAVWDDRRNAAAQMVLLLSGADPRSARKRLDSGVFGDHEAAPRAGLAFAEGDMTRAGRLLPDIDAAPFDDLPRAYAALVAGTLAAAGRADDRSAANAFFDRARLLAPGLLPEEAALRRQARLAEDMGDRERFARLSAQYLRRYARSVYARPFRQRLPKVVLAMARDAAALAAFDPLLDAFTPDERRDTLDRLAKSALGAGGAELARAAANRLMAINDEPTRRRAQLYTLAARALTGDADVGDELAKLDSNDPDVEALRRAALDVVRQVHAWPPPKPVVPPPVASPQGAPKPALAATTKPPLAATPGSPPAAAAKPQSQPASATAPVPGEEKIRKLLADGERLLGAAPKLAAP